jgi:hypothetical protein
LPATEVFGHVNATAMGPDAHSGIESYPGVGTSLRLEVLGYGGANRQLRLAVAGHGEGASAK